MNHMLKKEVEDKLTETLSPMEVKRIVDIGTGYLESATFFSKLKPNARIYTIDSFGLYGDGRIYNRIEHDKMFEINQKIQALGNVIQILGDSPTIPWELPIDVLFIDGDHTMEGCEKDFIKYSEFLSSGSIVCFDDYTQDNNPNNGVSYVVRAVAALCYTYEMIYEGYYCVIFKKL